MPDRTVHEVLVEARNLIDRVGWVQRDLGCPSRGFCLLGAMHHVASGSVVNHAGAVLHRLTEGHESGSAPIRWNNAPGRTKEEVLALLDEAIAATAPPPPEFDLKVPDHIAIVVEDIHARQ